MSVEKTEHKKMEAGKEMGQETKKVSNKQEESLYTLEEFVANAESLFHTNPECVFAALKQAELTKCSKAKAIEIVKAFRGRKVR